MRRYRFWSLTAALILLLTLMAAGVSRARSLPASPAGIAPQAQLLLEPTQMAWTSSADPDTNFGKRGYMWAGYGRGSGAACCSSLRGLVQFSLGSLPAGATISQATLYATIWAAQGPADRFAYLAGTVRSAWSETTVKWNGMPGQSYGPRLDLSATQGTVNWDVTEYVRAWASGASPNYGFALQRENDQTDPQEHTRMFGKLLLGITYSRETPTPTPTSQPSLTISKTELQDPVWAGDEIVYSIRVANRSSGTLAGVRVKDVLPPGTTFVEASNGGTVDDTGAVNWSLPVLSAGGTANLSLVVATSPNTSAGQVTNQATATYPCRVGQLLKTCTAQAAQTTTIKRIMLPPPQEYCLVDAAGNTYDAATAITLGAPGVIAQICPAADQDWYRFPAAVNDTIDVVLSGMTSDLDLFLVMPGGTVKYAMQRTGQADEHVYYRVPTGQEGDWRVAVISHPGVTTKGDYRLQVRVLRPTSTPTRPPKTPTPTATVAARLRIEKWLEESALDPGEDAVYMIQVTNDGPGTARNIRVNDTLPALVTYVSSEPSGTYDSADHSVSWAVPSSLAVNASQKYAVVVHVNDNAKPSDHVVNVAEARADSTATVRAESRDTVGVAGLNLQARVVSRVVEPGHEITVAACVGNRGTATARNVTLVAGPLPASLTEFEPTAPGDYDRLANKVTWELGEIPPDPAACVEVELTALVSPAAEIGQVLVIPWVAAAAASPDAHLSQSITVGSGCPDVRLTAELSDTQIEPGKSFQLIATVEQRHSTPVGTLELRITVPSEIAVRDVPADCTRGSAGVGCRFDGTPGSHRYSVALQMESYNPNGRAFEVTLDGTGLCAPLVETVEIDPLPDLRVDALEITQAVQDLNNSVRLIRGKTTYARFHVHSQSGTVAGVTARLWRRVNGQRVEPALEPVDAVIDVLEEPDRGELGQSFLFEIPDSWVDADLVNGTQSFAAEVNPDRAIAEMDYTNNSFHTRALTFASAPRLRVRYFNAVWYDDNQVKHKADPANFPAIKAWLEAAYPIARIDWQDGGELDEGWDATVTCYDVNAALIDRWTADGSPPAVHYLGVSNKIPWGCSPVPGNYSSSAADWWTAWDPDGLMADWYAGHELGHSYGMYHVCNGLNNKCGQAPAPPCEDYPYPTDMISNATSGENAFYGFNSDRIEVYPPTWTDMMSYCNYEWISDYTYEKLHDWIVANTAAAASAAAPEEGEKLVVIGSLNLESDAVALRTVSRVDEAWRLTEQTPGSYSLRLSGAGGAILAQHEFTPTLLMPGCSQREPTGIGGQIQLVVPWVADTQRIGIWHAGQELAGRNVSAHAPVVTLTYPNGGEQWADQPVTVTWNAADADGDTMRYMVQYSPDRGTTWQTLANRLTERQLLVDPTTLPGSANALVRVFANDGVNTGRDASNATFRVGNKPPKATIILPREGSTHRQGPPLLLRGQGQDLEDGDLAGANLAWSSSLDGSWGAGATLTVNPTAGVHVITLTATDSGGKTASTTVQVTVLGAMPAPSQCRQWLINGDFETGDPSGWLTGGNPAPIITETDAPGGQHALLLGAAAGQQHAGASHARQIVNLPADTSYARLTFRYRVFSRDASTDRDWFLAAITGADDRPLHIMRKHAGNTSLQTATVDLTPYRGQTIGIFFAVHNDGQAGETWALVDDVSLCVSAVTPQDAPGQCWLPGGAADYAPSGLPDFDQRQGPWKSDDGTWTHDGPTAVADLLWWRDAREETGTTAPPAVADSYRLVSSYGEWDDHAGRNVRPLIADLAARMNTNTGDADTGTDLGDLAAGLNTYLAARGLAEDYSVTVQVSPSYDWVREEAKQNRQVLLLLGFWEMQPTPGAQPPAAWRRLGGHYVAVAGTACTEEGIALSDPFRDGAESGWPGRVAPFGVHGHGTETGFEIHNDARYVSHDFYGITRTPSGWGPKGYTRGFDDLANFFGLNFAPAQKEMRAAAYLGGDVLTLVDYALVLAPRGELAELKVSPVLSQVRAGEIFAVSLDAWTGSDRADAVAAFLDFDPEALTVVDENGAPTNRIMPGTILSNVTRNAVDNASGRIGFAANGDPAGGRFKVATIRFKALRPSPARALAWSLAAPRLSGLTLGGVSVLDHLQGGAVRVEPAATLSGSVSLQGRPAPPNAAWVTPMLLTLSRPAERGPDYVYGVIADTQGHFTAPAVLAPDDYRVRDKGFHTLRNLLPANLAAGANTLDMGTLLEGDAVNNNRVDVRDVAVLGHAFGKTSGQAGFDARADFNADGRIDRADLGLLAANLGRHGDVLVDGAAAAAADVLSEVAAEMELFGQSASAAANGEVSLRLAPGETAAGAGDVATLEVMVDAGQPVEALALYLDYDPALLQAVDAAGQPATQVAPGDKLAEVLLNRVDAANGWVDFVAANLGAGAPTGTFTAARLHFKLLQAGETSVRFSFSPFRATDAVSEGESVLQAVAAAHIQVSGPQRIYLPLITRR